MDALSVDVNGNVFRRNTGLPITMKVQALFSDYDGTLAPLGVPRPSSRVPQALAEVLSRIHERIPVAIVTAKDYHFIRKRTPFADAWSCVYGMETVVKAGFKTINLPLRDLSVAVSLVQNVPIKPQIEYKRTSGGELCGFCAEWSPSNVPESYMIENVILRIRDLGFQVLYSSLYPMFDVIPATSDKGTAVTTLQKTLGVKGGLMFVGDSEADEPAFALSEISIGVAPENGPRNLRCDYHVKRRHMARFFAALLENDLVFSDRLPWLIGGKATK
jgi:trehalose-6-phosphatase